MELLSKRFVLDLEISVWTWKKAITRVVYSNWKSIYHIPNLVLDGADT